MRDRLMHEQLERGAEAMARLARASVVVCGAGALGANLCEGLARAGVGQLTVIDDDRIEARNLSTQPWGQSEIGQFKARMLANRLWRELGVELRTRRERLGPGNAEALLGGHDLIVDAFDNGPSRGQVQRAARALGAACVHAGMADGYGEVIWDEGYRVPDPSGRDVCDYPLARSLVGLVVAVAGEVILDHLIGGSRRDYTITLGDLRIEPWRGAH